jgi:hypothetical protein
MGKGWVKGDGVSDAEGRVRRRHALERRTIKSRPATRGRDARSSGRIVLSVCIRVKDILGRSDVCQARRGAALCHIA